MTTRKFDWTAFSLLAVLVLMLGAIAYGMPRGTRETAEAASTAPTAATGAAHDAAAHDHAASESAPRGGAFSLADLDATWLDQAGAERPLLGAEDGRLTVLTMAYTSCTVSCPRLIADLKRIEGSLSDAQRARVEFVMVSLDPARDTPARLGAYARDLHLDATRWALLTGDAEDIRELAAAIRVRYVMEANGEVSHTNRIVVLDAGGRPVHWQAGIGSGVEGSVTAITSAISR